MQVDINPRVSAYLLLFPGRSVIRIISKTDPYILCEPFNIFLRHGLFNADPTVFEEMLTLLNSECSVLDRHDALTECCAQWKGPFILWCIYVSALPSPILRPVLKLIDATKVTPLAYERELPRLK